MSDMNETFFTPEEIDEQIERLHIDQSAPPFEEAALRAIVGLHSFYEVNTPDDVPALQRVWQRVLDAEEQERAQSAAVEEQMPASATPDQLSDTPPERAFGRSRQVGTRPRLLLTQLVAVFCVLLIVGSFAWFSSRSGQIQSTDGIAVSVRSGKGSGNLYAYLGQTLYRLDSQTRRVLWQHTFASNEQVEDVSSLLQPLISSPFSVGNILYVLVRDTQKTDQQYLYAFDQSSGALLWNLPSARPLANSHAIYTLVESKISDVSTLTARNPQTGQQLWQKQYPIVGYKGDPGYGTDETEGFRLIAASDEVLYAVRWYHQKGQDFFARYALKASDGTIIWQNSSQLVSGRMPNVEAQIADGVIYTSEYNLKTVKPYTDSHGLTISEIPQTQIVAYDAQTGKKLWNTPEEVGGEPNPSVSLSVTNTMLYYEVYNQNWLTSGPQYNVSTDTLYALRRTDGMPQWRYQVKDTSMTSTVLDNKNLYVETTRLVNQQSSTNVVALDLQKGTLRWSTPVDALSKHAATPTPVPPSSTPRGAGGVGVALDSAPVVNYGVVYYSSAGNNVYALRVADGKILTQFSIGPAGHTTLFDRPFFFVVP